MLKDIHTDLLKNIRSGEYTDLLKSIQTFGGNNRRAEEHAHLWRMYRPTAKHADILEELQTF
jgi:hypothetical protein